LSVALHRMTRWRGIAVQVAVIAVAAGMAQTSAGHAILRRTGLFQAPSSYTSLAFVHPQSLPEQLHSNLANVPISFVIHDIGSVPRDYPWAILLNDDGRTYRVSSGNVRLAPNRDAVISRSVDISCTRGRVRITVSLATRPPESIDAWTACRSPRS
jgi:hypothetical protein